MVEAYWSGKYPCLCFGEWRLKVNNKDVTDKIRTNDVSMAAKTVSKNKLVRQRLVQLQRNMANQTSIVVDGQDIGTVVFPNADVKLFLVANLDERAKRRKIDFDKKGENISLDQVTKDLKERTNDDYTRSESPLKKAEDAVLIDNSNLTKEETLEVTINIIKKGLD